MYRRGPFKHALDKSKKRCQKQKESKTYNSGDSLVVTHLTTNPPVSCLNRAERTGSLVLKILWSYVEESSWHDGYNSGHP
jgi:hypothetical protein